MPKVVNLREPSSAPPPRCPRCNFDLSRPVLSAAENVAALIAWQQMHTPYWHWASEELVDLEAALETGDLLVRLFAQSVVIRRKSGIEITWEKGRKAATPKEAQA